MWSQLENNQAAGNAGGEAEAKGKAGFPGAELPLYISRERVFPQVAVMPSLPAPCPVLFRPLERRSQKL